MSRRLIPHAACRWAANRNVLAPSTSAARALHGTKPLAQQQEEKEEEEEEEAIKAPPAAASSSGEGGGRIFGSLPARTAAGRVGRGVLVGLPVVGAGFAAHLARKDYRKARSELKLAHVRLALAEMSYQRDVSRTAGAQQDGVGLPARPTLETSAARCFGVTAAIDSGIVAAHMLTMYGLYRGWEPDPIVNAGIVAMAGAVFSTGWGVRGEYIVASRELLESRAKRSRARSDDGGEGETGG